jgi:hypothetical protein
VALLSQVVLRRYLQETVARAATAIRDATKEALIEGRNTTLRRLWAEGLASGPGRFEDI